MVRCSRVASLRSLAFSSRRICTLRIAFAFVSFVAAREPLLLFFTDLFIILRFQFDIAHRLENEAIDHIGECFSFPLGQLPEPSEVGASDIDAQRRFIDTALARHAFKMTGSLRPVNELDKLFLQIQRHHQLNCLQRALIMVFNQQVTRIVRVDDDGSEIFLLTRLSVHAIIMRSKEQGVHLQGVASLWYKFTTL